MYLQRGCGGSGISCQACVPTSSAVWEGSGGPGTLLVRDKSLSGPMMQELTRLSTYQALARPEGEQTSSAALKP